MPSASASSSREASTPDLHVGGLVPLSTVDWPGQLVATIFAQGCPWDCPYCHNPHLLKTGEGAVPWGDVLSLLETRRGLLDGVVFSGGEPTLQAAIVPAVETVRAMGFRIGLHTNGAHPRRIAALLPFVDWVGFDVKAPFEEYERITRVEGSGPRALASLRTLVASGVPYQVRTTVHPALLDDEALERIAAELAAEGVTAWVRQEFRSAGVRAGELGTPAR
jgi:pyruvate formate lyase activating enzyme